MPRYLFDTNMCIYLIKNQPEIVARRFADCFVGDVVMSAITYAELEFGVTMSANPQKEQNNLQSLIQDIPVMSFDVKAASIYGPIRFATRDNKRDHLDKLIAAHAIAMDVILVTNNTKDFVKYPGLKIENWLD